MMRLVRFAILLLLLLPAPPARADYSRGGGFAAPGYGARAWGMGGAAVAVGSDEGAAFWNPALLSLLDRNRLGLSYINLVPGEEAQQAYASYSHIIRRAPLDEPDLAYARHAAGVVFSDLSLELSDGQDYGEDVLRLAYAYAPQYFLSLGASFSALVSTSDVENFGSFGTAIDLGARLVLSPRVTLGLVLRNVLSRVEFEDRQDIELPRAHTLGLAVRPVPALTIEGDVTYSFGGFSRYVIGGEYSLFSALLHLRGAVAAIDAGESRAVPYVGTGVHYRRIRIDYNANLDGEEAFGDTHRFSLGIGL